MFTLITLALIAGAMLIEAIHAHVTKCANYNRVQAMHTRSVVLRRLHHVMRDNPPHARSHESARGLYVEEIEPDHYTGVDVTYQ